MNVRRGLFRAWIVVSVLWIGAVMFFAPALGIGGKNYRPTIMSKNIDDPTEERSKILNAPWSSPDFYKFFRSPAEEKLPVRFSELYSGWQPPGDLFRSVDGPDNTKLYIHVAYNKADQDYITQQFWEQRWSRRMIDVALFAVVRPIVPFGRRPAVGGARL